VLGVGGSAIPVWDGLPPRWWPAEFLWVVGCSYRGQPTSRSPVRNMLGCNMSIRRTVLKAAAGFDDGLGRTARKPLGCEETELCIRARTLFPEGMFVLEPSALVHHRVPKSRASWRYFFARCGAEGISKARVAERVGSQAALAEERNYSFRVLPVGIAKNLAEAFRGDVYGLARAAAIVSGAFVTAARYGGARIAGGRSNQGPLLRGNRPRPSARRLLERLS
jgi:hypothetical protein